MTRNRLMTEPTRAPTHAIDRTFRNPTNQAQPAHHITFRTSLNKQNAFAPINRARHQKPRSRRAIVRIVLALSDNLSHCTCANTLISLCYSLSSCVAHPISPPMEAKPRLVVLQPEKFCPPTPRPRPEPSPGAPATSRSTLIIHMHASGSMQDLQ